MREKKERRRRGILTLWLPVNLSEHALVPVSGLVHTLVLKRGKVQNAKTKNKKTKTTVRHGIEKCKKNEAVLFPLTDLEAMGIPVSSTGPIPENLISFSSLVGVQLRGNVTEP